MLLLFESLFSFHLLEVLLGIFEKLKVLLAALVVNLGGVRSLIELA